MNASSHEPASPTVYALVLPSTVCVETQDSAAKGSVQNHPELFVDI